MFRTHCILYSLIGLALAWLLLACPAPMANAQEPPVSFIKDVAPILKENCFACHDGKRKKGKLDMTTFATFSKGGTKDEPFTPDKSKESVIIDMLTSTGPERMPPKENGDALPPNKIKIIARWIEQGAKLDQGIDPKADLMRELRLRWQPPQPPVAYKFPFLINALAFTPDAKKIVVGGYHELTFWDIEQGKLEKRLYTRAERAKALVFLPDGTLAVAGGRPGQEGDIRIYDTNAAGKDAAGVTILDGVDDKKVLLKELLETDDEVLALALSSDGKKLAGGGCDRLVRIWDLESGTMEQTIENHADWVLGVAFSHDNKYLITASRDKTAKIWDLAAKESFLTFTDHQNSVYGAGITSDGKTGFSVGEDGSLRRWPVVESDKNTDKKAKPAATGKPLFRVAYFPSAEKPLLATCGADGNVRLFNGKTGAALKTLSGLNDYVFALALSPDGQFVAGGSNNGQVRVWNTGDGTEVKHFSASPGYAGQN
jgi:mono/diheme cytochrome c family protein